MLNRLYNLKANVSDVLDVVGEVAADNVLKVLGSTISGFFVGGGFSIMYVVSEPEDQRKLILAALEQIQNTYNCTVAHLPSRGYDIRNVEFKCDDLFVQDQANNEAQNTIDSIKGTDLSAAGIILSGMFGGAALGFFGSIAAIKAKEKRDAIALERERLAEQAKMEEGVIQSKMD